jgi:hypothetical protein
MQLIGTWTHTADVPSADLELEDGLVPRAIAFRGVSLTGSGGITLIVGDQSAQVDLTKVEGAISIDTQGRAMGVTVDAPAGRLFTAGTILVWG